MKPVKIEIYLYADTDDEAIACKNAIRDFVEQNRQEGRAVTAKKITEALKSWKNNALVKAGIINFLTK